MSSNQVPTINVPSTLAAYLIGWTQHEHGRPTGVVYGDGEVVDLEGGYLHRRVVDFAFPLGSNDVVDTDRMLSTYRSTAEGITCNCKEFNDFRPAFLSLQLQPNGSHERFHVRDILFEKLQNRQTFGSLLQDPASSDSQGAADLSPLDYAWNDPNLPNDDARSLAAMSGATGHSNEAAGAPRITRYTMPPLLGPPPSDTSGGPPYNTVSGLPPNRPRIRAPPGQQSFRPHVEVQPYGVNTEALDGSTLVDEHQGRSGGQTSTRRLQGNVRYSFGNNQS